MKLKSGRSAGFSPQPDGRDAAVPDVPDLRRRTRPSLHANPRALARHECSCELLILPDGSVITHNLTPAVAALLNEVLHL